MTSSDRDPWPQRSEICIRGQLGDTTRSAFPAALHAETHGDRTVLTFAADQAAPYGALAEAEALGLEPPEVRPLPALGPQEPSP